MITYLLIGFTYAFAASIQPGPLQAFIISQTLKNGWKKTIPAAFAPVLSDIPIIILVLLILSNVPHGLLRFLQIGGGLLLLYLAYNSYKNVMQFEKLNTHDEIKNDNTLFKAVLVNTINPNPYLGWSLVMGPLFIKGYHESPVNGFALIGGFYITIIICQMGIIILFGMARNLGPKIARISLGIASAGLAAFGIFLLWQGVTNSNY
jgi:threonine/homoserine/homoserine lactone efflux protein